MIWVICFYAAVGILLVATASVIVLSVRGTGANSRLYLLIAAAFAASFALQLPIFAEQELTTLNKIVLALHGAAQTFTLDVSASDLLTEISARSGAFFTWYARLLGLIVILCPIFTVGLALSFAKSFWARVRLACNFRKTVYVFPELNERSLAMGESLRHQPNSMTIYANAYASEEDEPELLERARRQRAVCFRGDVLHLPLRRRGYPLRFLLMDDNESAMLSVALDLAKNYNKRKNTKIVLYSSSEAAGRVIDSSTCAHITLTESTCHKIADDPMSIFRDDTWVDGEPMYLEGVSLQRIDPIRLLAIEQLSEPELVQYLRDSAQREHTISLMIVGLGNFGKQLLKTAAWLYQIEGYRLEINVFDRRDVEETTQVLQRECPELLDPKLSDRPFDASHDIRIFSKTDIFTSTFDAVFESDEQTKSRLLRTQAVFITLGDDDKNIEAAIRLRVLFDRMLGLTKPEDRPLIHAVVYDDERLTNLNCGRAQGGLCNYKRQPYQIRFIGNLSEQYSFDSLQRYEMLEKSAIMRHLEWMASSHRVKNKFENDPKFRKELIELYRQWSGDPKMTEETVAGRISYDPYAATETLPQELVQQLSSYYQFEYYREASISTYLHKKEIVPCFIEACRNTDPLCTCKLCERRRITEHSRWNAYMRGIGYHPNEKRFDRGLLHTSLVPWNQLEPAERFKD